MSEHHGKFCWNELNTRAPEAAVEHYAALYGWAFESMPMEDGSNYHVASLNSVPVAGIYDMRPVEALNDIPDHWFSYIAHDNVDKAVKDVVKLGGSVKRPPFDVPGTGRITIVIDPVGAVVGIMTPEAMS